MLSLFLFLFSRGQKGLEGCIGFVIIFAKGSKERGKLTKEKLAGEETDATETQINLRK